MKGKSAVASIVVLLFLTVPSLMAQVRNGALPDTSLTVDTTAPPPDLIRFEKEPEIIRKGVPVYPPLAEKEGLQGRVVVKIWVDADGKPGKAEVLRSDNSIFNQTSIDAAMKYRFTPAIMYGKPVEVWVVVPFTFRLKGENSVPSDSAVASKREITIIRGLHHASNAEDSSVAPPDYVPVQTEPQIVKRALPVYPENALKDSIKAEIYVKVWVSATGTPHQAILLKRTVESGGRMLPFRGTLKHSYVMIDGRKVDAAIFDRPTIDAAMKYRFTPATMNDKPVAVWVVLYFEFHKNGTCSAPPPNGARNPGSSQI